MRYHWDKHDIVVARNKVQRLLEAEMDPEKRDYYARVIDVVNNTLFYRFEAPDWPEPSLQTKLLNLTASHMAYGRYMSIVDMFYYALKPHHDEIYDASDSYNYMEDEHPEMVKYRTYTHDEDLGIAREFYKGFDKEMYKYFMKIYEQRYKTFRFNKRPVKCSFLDGLSSGMCMGIGGVNKNFITVTSAPGLQKLGDTIHECGHAIKNLVVPEKNFTDDIEFSGEVESIFPELVFYRELGETIDPFQSKQRLFAGLLTDYENAANLKFQGPIINTWMDEGYKMNKEAYKILREDYRLYKQDVKDALSVTPESSGTYVISMAVALELLHIYFKEDRDKAMYLYKKIAHAPAKEDSMVTLTKLENELSGLDHVEEEGQEIVSSFKLALTRKLKNEKV